MTNLLSTIDKVDSLSVGDQVMVADSVFGEDAVVAVAIVGNVDAGINVTEVAVTDGIAIDAVVGNVVDAGINVID